MATIYVKQVINLVYKVPRLLDVNACSKLFREKRKLLIIGRCLELEHKDIINRFIEKGYALLSVCPEAEHINMVGFKLAGIVARGSYDEVSVLTVDGSLHCTQLHWMVEEVFRFMGIGERITRSHYVVYKGRAYQISLEAIKTSRYLYKVAKMIHGSLKAL